MSYTRDKEWICVVVALWAGFCFGIAFGVMVVAPWQAKSVDVSNHLILPLCESDTHITGR